MFLAVGKRAVAFVELYTLQKPPQIMIFSLISKRNLLVFIDFSLLNESSTADTLTPELILSPQTVYIIIIVHRKVLSPAPQEPKTMKEKEFSKRTIS